MERNSRLFLYLFLGLLALSAVLLLIFPSRVADFLSRRSNFNNSSQIQIKAENTVLDFDILRSPSFVSLKDNISDFDYDRICSLRQNYSISVISGEEGEEQETQPSAGCSLNNGRPFGSQKAENN